MGWVFSIFGVLVTLLIVLVVVAILVGRGYPPDHRFRSALRLRASAADVWKVITDFANQGAWNPIVSSAERLSDRDGREVWKEVSKQGPPMTLETLESDAPRRLVRSIVDEKQVFSGRWTFELAPDGDGTRLTLTEDGHLENPFCRTMVHVMGPGRYVDMYLRGLAAKLGEPAAAIEHPASGPTGS